MKRNSWAGRRSESPTRVKIWLPEDETATALQMTIVDPKIGPEVVLAIRDSDPRARRLFRSKGLFLRLKAGVTETDHGAIIFMAWFLPRSPYERSPVMYGELANPCDPRCIPLLEIAGEQTHFHVLLFSANNEFIRAMEVPNVYRLGELAEAAREASEEMPVTDYEAAQDEFHDQFDISTLLGRRAA